VIVEKTESLPFVPSVNEVCPQAPPAPKVTVYAVPNVAVKADSTAPPPPEIFGVGVGADDV
jgi:hypothetical protein